MRRSSLVPFIDLMAVTISFLIMTAVWTQLGRLSVSQSGGPSVETKTTVPVNLVFTEKELKLSAGGSVFDPIAIVRDASGRMELAKLEARFKELKGQLPDQKQITVQTEDGVRYEDLVRVIDACIGSGFAGVQVTPAEG